MRTLSKIAALASGVSFLSVGAASAVEIEYWQYVFDTRVAAVDQLIENFQAANPDITVKHVTFPYADYQTRVVAGTMAGQGPDVMQFFYGWLDNFIAQDLVQPLDPAVFQTAEIEADFFPIVSAMERDGAYYGLPTAVRSLALFYNKDRMAAFGLDPESPPATLDELIAQAKASTERDAAGNYTSIGLTIEMGGQDHQWWREALVRQFGGEPYDADGNVAYTSDAGKAAFQWYTDLANVEHVGAPGFMDEGQAAFKAGLATFTIDGTFRLGAFAPNPFEWGVTELPANDEGVRGNYSSYFANGIGADVEGEELEAAQKFLAYLSSDEAMQVWLDVVGELPARRAAALTDENLANPIYGPFLRGLEYAHTTRFYDEAGQRKVMLDAANRVFLEGMNPGEALDIAGREEQAIIDELR
ncbi:sugar ABC transporter substrate-binding protein [Ketogulonicigenium robustum]|uniref:Sugar ABC transporter substrate-binding protein n=1 Tax=Ketogulonicigenium robustum TaxID=92947 RepID=A0A1W6P0J1_9RHOB|nr:extracellular solute-binding protein [Ketogulonicigenium robustum]ARO15036.1 sugar ABC transporter substrate-binding protein [Ketogulonicigenium robustum]